MRIDWTQTLLGPEGQFGTAEGAASARLPARAILLAGRMAGLLGAVLIFVAAIAASPVMGKLGARMEEMLAVSGLLVVQVIGFAMARQIGPKGLGVLTALSGLQVLLLAGLSPQPGVLLATAALVLAELIAIVMLLKDRRAASAGFCVAGVVAGLGAMVLAMAEPLAAALVAGIAIPSLAMLPLTLAKGHQLAPQAARPSSLAALLDVALSRFPARS